LDQVGDALEFVSQNGEELVRNIFFNTHNIIASSSDYFWTILKDTKQDKAFQNEDHAFLALLTTFLSVRTEVEMQAIYERYGEDVYMKLGEYISSYYKSFLMNYTENEEESAVFLMHSAHETFIDNIGEDYDILLALQFKKIAETDKDMTPDIFHPLMPALSEGGTLVDIIEDNI
jgi:hypothetical protein